MTLWDATWPPAHLSRTDLPHRKHVHFLFPPCVHSMCRFLLPVSLNCRPQMSHGKGPAATQKEYVRKYTFLFPSTGETRTRKCRHLSGTFPGASVGQSGTWSSRRSRRIWTAGAESARSCAPPGEGGVWTTCGRSTTWKRFIVIFIIIGVTMRWRVSGSYSEKLTSHFQPSLFLFLELRNSCTWSGWNLRDI